MSKSSVKSDLERRAWQAMLTTAFFRWESAATIALVILLAFFLPKPFPGWQWWFWLIGGALAEAAIIYASVTDPAFASQVVAHMLRQEYNPNDIQDKRYRAYLEQAMEYRERIEGVVAERQDGALREHIKETAREIDDWTKSIYEVAGRLDQYSQDHLIRRDLQAVPLRIRNLQKQLDQADDPSVRTQVEETLLAKQRQWENLEQLQHNMQRAELQLEHTLTAMGTIYSQMLLVEAKDVDSGRVKRLREELSSEVQELQDVLDSMDEVYATRAAW
jgi:chromosome segregation ATPase